MIIRKIHIDGFGTLTGKDYVLEDGLNVLSGIPENEAGAPEAFITAMLYGMSGEEAAAYRPAEENAPYGGSLEILQNGTAFRIDRSFTEGEEKFKVTRLSDNAAAAYPELWIAEALNHVPKETFQAFASVNKDSFSAAVRSLSESAEDAAEREKEDKIRGTYEAVRDRFASQCVALDEKINWGTRAEYERLVTKIKALKERQLAIRKECPEKEQELDALKEMRDLQDMFRADEENEKALEEEAKNAKNVFGAFLAKAHKRAERWSSFGTLFMTLGMLLFIVTWFYEVSVLNQHVSGQNALYVNGAVVLSGVLFLCGLAFAIVSAVKLQKAERLPEEDTEEKRAADTAQDAFERFHEKRLASVEAAKNDPVRNADILSLTEKVEALRAEIREGTAEYTELYRKVGALRNEAMAQAPAENEYRALGAAADAMDRLIAKADREKEAKEAQMLEENGAKALSGILASLREADPAGRIPFIAGGITAGMSEETRETVYREQLSKEDRQVILFQA